MTSPGVPFLRIEKLSKSYREGSQLRSVLVETDAAFARGDSTAILGRSGSGKITLLNIISGIDRMDAGQI